MEELVKTTNPALISFVTVLLKNANIHAVVVDTHASIMEGSIGFLIPRRILVPREDLAQARAIIEDADLAAELAERP